VPLTVTVDVDDEEELQPANVTTSAAAERSVRARTLVRLITDQSGSHRRRDIMDR